MKDTKSKVQVWSCGGGTQSCAIAVLIIQGKLPKPDIAVIADTGRETEATWEYYNKNLKPSLATAGIDLVRIKAADWAPHGESLFPYKNHTVPIPVYSTQSGTKTKLENYCTGDWKTKVIRKWLVSSGVVYAQTCRWIGFSVDETLRWMKMMKGEEYQRGLIRLPLVFDVRLKRREAIKLVEDFGWPTPPRSACWMCPNHSDNEWRKLIAECPDEFQKAVELEREIHKTDPDAWLHRSCIPLDQVDFSQPDDLFSRPCDSGMCFV